MAIISAVFGSHCHGEDVIARVTEKLGYRNITEELFRIATDRYEANEEQLRQSLVTPMPQAGKSLITQERNLAYLQAALAELLQPDQVLITGCPAFLLATDISHILRVLLIADHKYRLEQCRKAEAITEPKAAARIKTADQNLAVCASHFSHKRAFDERLYDMVVPMDRTTVAEAAGMICDQTVADAVATTDRSRDAVKAFKLAALVKVALLQRGWRVEVFAEAGHVIVGVNDSRLNLKRVQPKIEELAQDFPGVEEVTVKLGSKYSPPSINPWDGIEAPPKILLVDDEKEFVHTLSERLKTRNIDSSVAYTGEQALDMLKSEVADVIVLDLLMPGIDGIETLRRVKKHYPNVEVIILTGHGSKREQDIAEELGAYAYLQKPVNVNELARVMKAAYLRARGGS